MDCHSHCLRPEWPSLKLTYYSYALKGQPYTIFFVLQVDEDHVYYVGQISTFSAQLSGDCGNCESQKKHGVLSKGQVPLTPQLVRLVRKYSTFLKDASGITGVNVGLNPEFMNVFLQKTLYWHVLTVRRSINLFYEVYVPVLITLIEFWERGSTIRGSELGGVNTYREGCVR